MKIFNDVYNLAAFYDDKYHKVIYPQIPEKRLKRTDETNKSYGEYLDSYDEEKRLYSEKIKEYNNKTNEIRKEFRFSLLEYLGIKDHPKADKLYSMAWEDGHSNGFSEVAMIAENLAELIK